MTRFTTHLPVSHFPAASLRMRATMSLRTRTSRHWLWSYPRVCLKGTGNGVIGAWTNASTRQVRILNENATFAKPEVNGGAWTKSRAWGCRSVNEVVIGLPDKDHFNSSVAVERRAVCQLCDQSQLTCVAQCPVPGAGQFDSRYDPAESRSDEFSTQRSGRRLPYRLYRSESAIYGHPIGNAALEYGDRARTPAASQNTLGVIAGDVAGFPNGRRPGDDVVDVSLRVVMGALCYPLPIGTGGAPTNLGLCTPAQAPVGNAAFTDGAPINALDFDQTFPYLQTPLPGSPIGAM